MGRPAIIAFSCGVAVVLALAAPARGDGCYVSEVAYPAAPKIPSQRALIVYRDGVETLVVESAMNTESPSVGWVLPLPSEPTKLEVADPGMLPSLAFCVRPRIVHDLHEAYWPAVLILGFLIPLAAFAILSRTGLWVLWVLCWGVYYLLVLMVLMPAGMEVSESAVGVEVRSAQRIGNYDVSVLRADDATALSRWLEANVLKPLDERSRRLVEDYIGRGWCFVVARLVREGPGEAVPHPIRATFPVKQPVYPMKLTALAASACRVELFVVADGSASAQGFRVQLSDRPRPVAERDRGGILYARWPSLAPIVIGSPDVQDLLWDGCAVTRLEADLEPAAMDRDVEIAVGEFRPERLNVYSPRGRREAVLSVLLWGLVPFVISAAVVCYKRRRPGKKGLVFLASLGGVIAVSVGITSLALPVVPVGKSTTLPATQMRLHAIDLVVRIMAHNGLLHRDMTFAELADFPRKAVELKYLNAEGAAQAILNPFTGEPMRVERSPGNFSTRKVGDEVYFCLYDRDGSEIRVTALPPQGAPERGARQ